MQKLPPHEPRRYATATARAGLAYAVKNFAMTLSRMNPLFPFFIDQLFTVLAVDIQRVAFFQYPLARCGDRGLQGIRHAARLSARHGARSRRSTVAQIHRRKVFSVAQRPPRADEAPSGGQSATGHRGHHQQVASQDLENNSALEGSPVKRVVSKVLVFK